MLRTPETPSMPRYRAGKSSAFTPQSRRAVQTPRERERRERERARQRERDCSTSSDRMRRLERKKRFENPSDVTSPPTSPIVMLRVGPQKRLFAAHEAILSISPFFAAQIQSQNHIQVQAQIQTPTPTPSRARTPPRNKLIDLPEEQAEVLSCILEFLYKGDYYPRLRHNANKQTWELEDADLNPSSSDGDGDLSAGAMATVYHHQAGCVILRDTAV
ncbi:uncharacterized protein N7511_006819 [Penicillium nucicola]|uniref:uncharacterized protein n=1 Tax=Penicillium nucicola TaxID=1850975 RepID=UPI0025451A05|nr:uncharacterized protein N7511_006819 [Penicillium nucicola]KAJ5758125.1 hypothetical protein N7511_006819 [Penicillium nucicola]